MLFRLVFVLLAASSSVGSESRTPQYEVFPRQGVSNRTLVSSTTSSAPTSTGASSTAAITSAPLSASGNVTCPNRYASDFQIVFETFTKICQENIRQATYHLYYGYRDNCLAAYCESAWTSDWMSIMSSNSTIWATSTRTFFQGFRGTGSQSTVYTSQSYSTVTFSYRVNAASRVREKAPCCGRCIMANPTIEFYFWPTEAATPSLTGLPANATAVATALPSNAKGTYVDDLGFTFKSPSVYIGFTSLAASNFCGTVGTMINKTTIAFDPTEISTLLPQVTRATCLVTSTNGRSTITMNAADVTIPSPLPLTYSDVAQDCSTIPGYYWFANEPSHNAGGAIGDPCHPVIALPTKVQQLQPDWLDCMPAFGGFYDPPRTLRPGIALVPTTAPGPGQGPTSKLDTPPSSAQPDPAHHQPDPTQPNHQPGNPAPSGSSTTIMITPPPWNPLNPNNPNPPPVITLDPQPNDPSNPNPTRNQPGPSELTIVPTIIPPSPNNPNPGSGNAVVIVGTQTLSPGGVITVGGTISTLANGQTIVVGGTQVVLDPQGTQLLIDHTSTVVLPHEIPAQETPVLKIGDEMIIVGQPGPIVVHGQTLQPGSTLVVDGTTVSLAPGGTQMIVDGSTIALPGISQTDAPIVVTVGGTALTANSLTQFTIDGKILTVGGAITVSGMTYILTTNDQGSTILVAGTAGVSSPAVLSARTTDVSENSKSIGSRSDRTTEGGSATTARSISTSPSKGAGERIGLDWKLIKVLLSFSGWAMMLR